MNRLSPRNVPSLGEHRDERVVGALQREVVEVAHDVGPPYLLT